MRVMQVKHNQRVKMNQVNSRQLFSLNFSNTGSINGKCCGFGKDKQTPSHQQSYSNYNRRAMSGLGGQGGPASRVQNGKASDRNAQLTNTVKRNPSFTPREYIANVRSEALRCDYSSITYEDGSKKCKPDNTPICHNNCGKQGKYTQDLGYLSSSQQLNKKLALRAGSDTTGFKMFEKNIYGGGGSKC